MSTRPGSTLDAMALTSFGPEEFDDPELPLLPELPVLPELPKAPPLPKGEPFPKRLPGKPEPPDEFEPPDPDPDGRRALPDVGLKACVLPPLFVVAWPMPKPAPRTASAAAPASRPLRTRWLLLPGAAAGARGAGQVGAPGLVGGGGPKEDAGVAPSIGLPARAPMA